MTEVIIPYLFDKIYEPPIATEHTFSVNDNLFGITYKILRGKLTEQNYDYIIRNLNNHGTLIEHTFEKDKSGRLHIHGLWQARTPRMQLRNLVHKGTTNRITPIYDLEGWLYYIHKEERKS